MRTKYGVGSPLIDSCVFSNLHRDRQIGSDCFLATCVPIIGDEEDWDTEYANPSHPMISPEVEFIGDLKFYIANNES